MISQMSYVLHSHACTVPEEIYEMGMDAYDLFYGPGQPTINEDTREEYERVRDQPIEVNNVMDRINISNYEGLLACAITERRGVLLNSIWWWFKNVIATNVLEYHASLANTLAVCSSHLLLSFLSMDLELLNKWQRRVMVLTKTNDEFKLVMLTLRDVADKFHSIHLEYMEWKIEREAIRRCPIGIKMPVALKEDVEGDAHSMRSTRSTTV